MAHRGSKNDNYIQLLQKTNVYDIKKRISEKLAEDMAKAQKKERKFKSLSSILKTGAKFLPGFGKLAEFAVDPALRAAGMGADPSALKAREGNTAWGGREGYKTARKGLEKSQKDYRAKSLTDSLTGLAGGKLLGGLGNIDSYGDGITNKMVSYMDDVGYESYLDDFFAQQGGLIPSYNNGGMVQKYQNGGAIDYVSMPDYALLEMIGKIDPSSVTEWKEKLEGFTGAVSRFALINELKSKEGYSPQEGQDTDVSTLTTSSEEGINTFLKTPEMAALVKSAREGDEDALAQLAEVARQQRPELRNKNTQDLMDELKNMLPEEIDPYGQDYKDVATKAGQQVQGLKGQAVASAGAGSMMASTGMGGGQRQARQATGSLSSSLSDIYAKRDVGFKDAFEDSFGGLESMFTTVGT
jgi:hypothetical protein